MTKQEFIVVSNHRIIYVTRNDMFGTWSVSIHVLLSMWTDKCHIFI